VFHHKRFQPLPQQIVETWKNPNQSSSPKSLHLPSSNTNLTPNSEDLSINNQQELDDPLIISGSDSKDYFIDNTTKHNRLNNCREN
jgi:hypothetical protein